ncbi:MAG: HAMP domain-containing histidine kinase [bacterium]|nr:HAMP domain-containing histidine kinase [bacterium]
MQTSNQNHSRTDSEDLPGRVAHAIGTPLSALIGTAQMCVEDANGSDPRLDRILRLSRRVAAIVRGMLDLSRTQTLDWSKNSARGLLGEAAAELSDRCEKSGIDISTRVRPDVPIFDADKILLVTALVSLAENSVDEMEETGGELQFEAEYRPGEGPGSVVLSVTDTGRGIPADLREEVFEPFVTSRHSGAGLGLPIARQIVEGHSGTLRLSDPSCTGTRMTLEIPVSRAGLRGDQ